jgi:hypothetical protein
MTTRSQFINNYVRQLLTEQEVHEDPQEAFKAAGDIHREVMDKIGDFHTYLDNHEDAHPDQQEYVDSMRSSLGQRTTSPKSYEKQKKALLFHNSYGFR